MALLPILCYPDPRLHTVAKPVAAVDDRIQTLVADMFATMYDANGIGLAATQVNVHERLIVIDASEDRDQPLVLINPEVVWASPETQVSDEGCLSVPGIYDGVARSVAVRVTALNLDGQPHTVEAEGLLAVCIQHEMDHLDRQGVRGIPVAPEAQPHQDQDGQGPAAGRARGRALSVAPRVVFAGTPEFARVALQALHVAGFHIPLVLTQPDRPAGRGMKLQASPVKQFALRPPHRRGAAAQPAARRQVPGRRSPGPRRHCRSACRRDGGGRLRADPAAVGAGHAGSGLPQYPRRRCCRAGAARHPSTAPLRRATVTTGITIMQMDAGLDTGDMLLVERAAIAPYDTTARLHDRLATLGGRLVVEALEIAACGGFTPVPQPAEGVTYAHKIEKAEAAIDWSQPAEVIERRVRAFDPFPGASTALVGEAVKVWRSEIESATDRFDDGSGQILSVNGDGVRIQCGQGVLRLTELQRAGGKRLPVADFLRGFPLQPGQTLG